MTDPLAAVCTLPAHLRPKAAGRPSLLARVAADVDAGRAVPPDVLRDALADALGALLGAPTSEVLPRLRLAGPQGPSVGLDEWTDAIAIITALTSGGGVAAALGLPPPAAERAPQDVLAESVSYRPLEVVGAMRALSVGTAHVVSSDGTWAVAYLTGSSDEVEAALSALRP